MASTAIPVNFPYQVQNGRILFTGSLAHSMEIASGINYCKYTLGFDDVDI